MLPKEGYNVVISGVGGKFPGTNNIAELQEKLFAKEDLVTQPSRWAPGCFNTPKATGNILEENKFDANFFGLYRRLCMLADPMMKLTMERCYEALIDAGINPFTLKGRNIAVVVSTLNSESEILNLTHEDLTRERFAIQGHSQALIANRISYFLNITGPSVAVNFSNSGGMFALEHAATLIRQGAVPAALVATSYLMWYPSVSTEYADLNLLTFDSKTYPFDDQAKGMIRSDGVVVYFLQRKEDANRIYANIINVDSKCLGSRDCSFLKFDIRLQQFLSNFYKHSGCDTAKLAYLEPEGMAVKNLDAIELNSLANVLYPGRKSPLLIGSVKSNVGHAHVAASFMALAKAIIAMETGLIPPTLNYQRPNSDVPALLNGSLKVVTEETPLEGDLVAVNNLSFSGTVGHILLQRHDKAKAQQTTVESGALPLDGLPRLVLFSACHEEGAKTISQKIQSMPLDTEFISLVNNIHKVEIPNHLYRSYTVVPTISPSQVDIAFSDSKNKRPIWFLFSGMGSQWKRMGQELLKLPVFAAAMKKCDEVLKPKGVDIEEILTSDDDSVFENLLSSFVGITAVQVGLVDVLSAVGVQPDGIIGHSAGEVCCGYADGCLTIQQTVLAAWARGKATMDAKLIKGLMAAVGTSYKDVQKYLPATVDVACHNSSSSCTISGPKEDILQVMNILKEKDIFVKAVNSGERSYHSRYIVPIVDNLRQLLKEIIHKPKARSSRWICTSVSKEDWETENAKFASPDYYINNMINPVLFQEGLAFIPEDAIVIEIAPYGLMQAIMRRALTENVINIPLTSKTAESNLVHLLSALGKLHNSNVDIDVNALYPAVEYPVSRGTPSLAPLVTWDHADTWFVQFTKVVSMITDDKSEMFVVIDENSSDYKLWSEHSIDNETTVPLSQLLAYPWKFILETKKLDYNQQAIEIQDVVVARQILVNFKKQEVEVGVFRGSEKFEVSLCSENSTLELCVTGKISVIKRPTLDVLKLQSNSDHGTKVTRSEFYRLLAQHSHRLGPQFQVLQSLFISQKDFKAIVTWTGDLRIFLDSLFKLLVFINCKSENQVVNPSSIRRLVIDAPHFFDLPKGSEVDVYYNSKTNVLCCEGLQLEGLTVSAHDFRQMKSTSLVWKNVKFVPYTENILKLEEFFNTSVQLVAEEGLNSWSNKVASFVTLEIRDDLNKPFIAHAPLQNLLKYLPNVSTRIHINKVQKVKQDLKQAQHKTCLVIGEYKSLLQLVDFIQDQRNIFYLTFLPNGEQLEDNKLQQILSHQMKEGALVLLKKWSDHGKLRVFQLDWMAGLRQFMSHNRNGQPVIVVSRQWQPRQALKTLALESYAHQLRCVFLDKQAPQFSLTSPLFHRQLSLGLTVNVLSGRTWGSYRTTDLPHLLPDTENLSKLESSVKSLQLSCIALNTRNFTLRAEVPTDQVKMKYLDYCGTKRNGEKVMGIATFDEKSEKVVPDQSLVWTVPSQWTFENAVTVPFSYSLAYYSLLLRAKLVKGESVLIHAGMSPIGQAAIAVSLETGADLYVTVSTSEQSEKLLILFPQINVNNVIVMERSHFEIELKRLTKNQGINVIVNCLKGNDINASFRCLSNFSRMVHFGDISVDDKEELGMFPFSRYNDFFGISLDNLINSADSEKEKLKTLVENGIKHGVVKPVKSSQFSFHKATDAFRNFQYTNSEEKTVLLKSEFFSGSSTCYKCNPKESFIIIGTKHGLWLNLAEWLLRNGARKLIIASLKQNLTTNVTRKFNKFMSQHSATIVMTTISRLDTNKDAEEFIQEAARMGPVGGIFCSFMELCRVIPGQTPVLVEVMMIHKHLGLATMLLKQNYYFLTSKTVSSAFWIIITLQDSSLGCPYQPLDVSSLFHGLVTLIISLTLLPWTHDVKLIKEEKSVHVSHLDAASRQVVPQLKQFVCLLGGSASVCQSRAELGLSACLVQSETPLHKPHTILPYLSTVLANNSSTHTFLVSDYSSISKHRGLTPSLQDIKTHLPTSLKQLETLGLTFYNSTLGELQERVTLSPGHHFVRFQLLPVFLVPGVDSTRLEPLIKQLIHPAFCPRLAPCLPTVPESACLLVQKLLHIQSKGPYNIVGETWSGAVALQMAIMLDSQGHQVNLFLLEAAPQKLHLWAKTFCHHSEEFSNTKFLMVLLNLPANAGLLQELLDQPFQLKFAQKIFQDQNDVQE